MKHSDSKTLRLLAIAAAAILSAGCTPDIIPNTPDDDEPVVKPETPTPDSEPDPEPEPEPQPEPQPEPDHGFEVNVSTQRSFLFHAEGGGWDEVLQTRNTIAFHCPDAPEEFAYGVDTPEVISADISCDLAGKTGIVSLEALAPFEGEKKVRVKASALKDGHPVKWNYSEDILVECAFITLCDKSRETLWNGCQAIAQIKRTNVEFTADVPEEYQDWLCINDINHEKGYVFIQIAGLPEEGGVSRDGYIRIWDKDRNAYTKFIINQLNYEESDGWDDSGDMIIEF